MRRFSVLSCLVLLGLPTLAPALDWPQWRGPERNGVAVDSPELIDVLPETLTPAWEVDLPPTPKKPPYYGTPIGTGGAVYFHGTCVAEGADPKDKKAPVADLIIAVDLESGEERWRQLSPAGTGSKLGAPNSPCVHGELLYALAADGTLRARRLADGAEAWAVPVELDKKPGFFVASPLVAAGYVVVGDKKRTKAFDPASGEVAWTAQVGTKHASPALWRAGDREILLAGERTIAAVDAADGAVLWTVEAGRGPSSLVVAGDRLARVIEGTGVRIWNLSADGVEELTTIEIELAGGGHNACTPVFAGDRIYVAGKSEVLCYDLAADAVAWKGERTGDAKPSPVLAAGKVLFGGKKKRTVAMFAADEGTPLGTAGFPMTGCSSFALVDGRLVAQGGGKLRAFDLRAR